MYIDSFDPNHWNSEPMSDCQMEIPKFKNANLQFSWESKHSCSCVVVKHIAESIQINAIGIVWVIQYDGIDGSSIFWQLFARKPYIGCVRIILVFPWHRTVDGFTIDSQPFAQIT